MTFYDDMQSVATNVHDDFKQGTVRLVKITSGSGPAYNPGAPTKTYYVLSATVKGVSFLFVQQGFSTETDFEVIASVRSDVTPDLDDFIEIDGVEYKIVKDISVPSAGTKVAWKFIVRKGG